MWSGLLFAVALVTLLAAATTELNSTITTSNLSYVNNSGICETTPGVHTMSGYVNVAPDKHTWFWFFAARQNASTAPLVVWFNGGPGCSSMIGLFQEHGPCTVNEDGNSTTLNPHSWNEVANVLYIDQPIGTGFSYGNASVVDTEQAAEQVWQAIQLLFKSGEFAAYESRDFILATESYGGHYGPAFARYFQSQNAAIQSGTVQGEPINLKALMVNNGLIDPLIQYKGYIDFATNAPGYGPIASPAAIQAASNAYNQSNGCQARVQACYNAGSSDVANPSLTSSKICADAFAFCEENVVEPLLGSDFDVYDIREPANDPYPPSRYISYLQSPAVQKAIGAKQLYEECPGEVYSGFSSTGDWVRTWLPELSALVDSKLKVLIWAGDADFICNWVGVHEAVLAMDWYGNQTFANMPFANITVGGKPVAAVKNFDNFSFARVYEAGHEVPYYQPEAALAILQQVIAGEPLHSTDQSDSPTTQTKGVPKASWGTHTSPRSYAVLAGFAVFWASRIWA